MATASKALVLVFLAACGGGGGGDDTSSPDASNVPAMITISGKASKRNPGASDAPGVMIAAYQASDPNTPVATATSDATGMYSMVITTNGKPLDGYLKATLTGYLDTYLYAPKPIDADFSSASINMVTSGTVGTVSGTLCGMNQDTAKGMIAMITADANNTAVAGAMGTSSPAAGKVCYDGSSGFPDKTATATATDGIVYLINVTPGTVTVNASGTGAPYHSHDVNARAGVFTTTVIQP